MVKTAIIGAGGIGSWFCYFLSKFLNDKYLYYQNNNDSKDKRIFDLYDYDLVTYDNCSFQHYPTDSVFLPKSLVTDNICNYYKKVLNGIVSEFTSADLDLYDEYIICADNAKIRHMVYKYVINNNKNEENKKKWFLDLRAEGDVYVVYTSDAPEDELLSSLGKDEDVSRSCQFQEDKNNGNIELGFLFAVVNGLNIYIKHLKNEDHLKYLIGVV